MGSPCVGRVVCMCVLCVLSVSCVFGVTCAVCYVCCRVCHEALLEQFLTLYNKGVFRALLVLCQFCVCGCDLRVVVKERLCVLLVE